MKISLKTRIEALRRHAEFFLQEEMKGQAERLHNRPLELARFVAPQDCFLSVYFDHEKSTSDQLEKAGYDEKINTASLLISYIDGFLNAGDKGNAELAQEFIFEVGRYAERFHILFFEKHREDMSFKVIQSEHTKKQSRWKERNYPIELALQVADALYKDGDDRPHHKMVEHLLDTIPAFQEMQSGDDYLSCKRRLLRGVGELVKLKYPERFYNPGKGGRR